MNRAFDLHKMGDFLRIKHGYPFKSEFFVNSGSRQITSLGSFYEKGGFKRPDRGKEKFTTEDCPLEYVLRKGDMIIAMTEQVKGLLGAAAWIPEDDYWLLNQRSGLVIFFNDIIEVDPKFIFYLFAVDYVRLQISRPAQGTKQRNTSPESIYDVKVWLPKIEDQRTIGNLLYSIDRKIEINNAINAELERLAKTIYEYWFVQFDFPNAEGKPYKSSGGEMVYNEILKREIPKGWEFKPLTETDLCRLIQTGVDSFDGEKIYLSTSEVDGSEIINHSVLTNFPNRLSRANMQPQLNSVWFAKMKATYKNILVDEGATELIDSYIFSTGFSGLECRDETVHYLWNYLKGDYFEHKKNLLATGATQQAINEDDIDSFAIVVPPGELLEKFRDTVKASYLQIGRNKRQNLELAALRDFLLPLLMNGQVTVDATTTDFVKIISSKPSAVTDDSKYQAWKVTVGLAARGDINEQTLRKIYEALDADDR